MAWPSVQSLYHQLNPFDGGRTYDTDQRGVAPGTPYAEETATSSTRTDVPSEGATQTQNGITYVYTNGQWVAQGGGSYDNSGGGGGGGSSFTDTSAARSATQSSLDSLDTELETGFGNIDKNYYGLVGGTLADGTKITGQYDTEAAKVQEDYDEGVVDNNNALSRNRHNSMLAAAQGRRGLRGALASLGALSGDGSVLADQAVSNAANADLGESSETFKTNAGNLDDAYEDFEEEDIARREAAKAERTTQRRAEEGRIASKRQNYLTKMAELWASAGNNTEAAKYLGMTEPLNETIAASAGITPSGFQPGAAAFTPGSLEQYLAGAGDMSVKVAGGGAGNAPTLKAGHFGRRDREEEY